jgi:predicted O-methyltransferase YrrM
LDWTAHDVHPYIVHVCTDSRNAAAIINAACKLVFIDGEHSTEAVVHDIRAFGAMVKPGGVLVVDDFSPDDPILGQPAQDTIDMFGYFEEQVWFNRRCLVARRDT